MYNHFREQLKDGMGELAKKQGTGGLPKAPDTTTVTGDVPPPEPDKTAEKTLKETQSAADQTETEVKQEAGAGSGGGSQEGNKNRTGSLRRRGCSPPPQPC